MVTSFAIVQILDRRTSDYNVFSFNKINLLDEENVGSHSKTIIFIFNRVIFILTKRQEMDNTLGSSKAVSVANKQLTRTCVVVTCVFIVTLGKSFYSHYRLIDFFLPLKWSLKILCSIFQKYLIFVGYDHIYYFLGRWGLVVYTKNNFLQKLGM